jgi:hypothetical protein
MPAVRTTVPASMPHTACVDRANSGRDVNIDTATLEHARRGGCQCRVDLWQDARACFEQPKAEFVAPDVRIEAQDVVGERRQLAYEFYADQTAANDDNRQTPAPLGGVCRWRT